MHSTLASRFSFALLLLVTTASFDAPLRADEGMFPMSELGKLDLKAKGIELTADELFNPKGLSLVDESLSRQRLHRFFCLPPRPHHHESPLRV